MKRNAILWILSFLITVAAAYYQRVTGPTYPIAGTAVVGGHEVRYRMDRSHGGDGDAPVVVTRGDEDVHGILQWKRHKTSDDWTSDTMQAVAGLLTASLPHQPPAGKLDYRVIITRDAEQVILPAKEGTVLRFKGDVPTWILILHVIAMFGAMLLSTRTGLEVFNAEPQYFKLIIWTLAFLTVGGMILGPVVQKYAFGAYWTGWPIGTDLTDNKTFIAFLGWVAAAVAVYRGRRAAPWAIGAAVLLFVVYLVPHSVLGSEIDYNKSAATREVRP